MFDLILRGGHLVDPSQGIDARDIASPAGRSSPSASASTRPAETRDVSGLFVAPGLIDLHTHVYWGGTSIGVDAATVARRGGTTPGRCGKRRPRQLSGIPSPRHRAIRVASWPI
jgi:dihydroorotase